VFCGVIEGCDPSGQPVDAIVSLQGIPQATGSASHIVNFDSVFDYGDAYGDLVYCVSACYDMNAAAAVGDMSGYDGVTPYEVITYSTGVDYDVGSAGGQFMMVTKESQSMAAYQLTESQRTDLVTAYYSWFYHWFDWFGATAALGDGYGAAYTWADVVTPAYPPQAPEEGTTVTFTEYPPKGWLGWCTVENCEGQSPRGIRLGYEYNAQYYYFVYFATLDAFQDPSNTGEGWEEQWENLLVEVKTWIESYYVWLVEPEEPAAPEADAVSAILLGINAPTAPLTLTLLWNAQVDLDLYFYCQDGSQVNYQNTGANPNANCGGTLDADMQASSFGNTRGDGSVGQVENISVQGPQEGFEYSGKVNYFAGSGNAEFQVIFSGTDPEGVLHVYGQEYVADFATGGANHEFSFTYSNA